MNASNEEIQFCLAETYKHIKKVGQNINVFVQELLERSYKHDQSKLESPELDIMAPATYILAKTEYGTPEYQASLDNIRPALDHHYSKNRHHPEFHKNGIDDMDLVDLIELFSDWKAATERQKNGNLRKSIEVNTDRYGISPQLKRIFENTVKRYFDT